MQEYQHQEYHIEGEKNIEEISVRENHFKTKSLIKRITGMTLASLMLVPISGCFSDTHHYYHRPRVRPVMVPVPVYIPPQPRHRAVPRYHPPRRQVVPRHVPRRRLPQHRYFAPRRPSRVPPRRPRRH